jgi:hypothetical protein
MSKRDRSFYLNVFKDNLGLTTGQVWYNRQDAEEAASQSTAPDFELQYRVKVIPSQMGLRQYKDLLAFCQSRYGLYPRRKATQEPQHKRSGPIRVAHLPQA